MYMDEKYQDFIDSVFGDLAGTLNANEEMDIKVGVTFWLPEKHEQKFRSLQKISKKKFGKKMQEILCKVIESVNLEHHSSDQNAV